jgi:SAM-dependent methyltransferase
LNKYVQYGCGDTAPAEWLNFDASPTLKIQKTPVLGFLLKSFLNIIFPKNVQYGDIVKNFPVKNNSCDGIYCSHVLEHLSYEDCIKALKNTYDILKPGGIFRLVMPDFKNLVNVYLNKKESGDRSASTYFMEVSYMATKSRPKGFKAIVESIFGNAKHLWLWDKDATIFELEKIGFKNIRECEFNDSTDRMFQLVEDWERFQTAVALEMTK